VTMKVIRKVVASAVIAALAPLYIDAITDTGFINKSLAKSWRDGALKGLIVGIGLWAVKEIES
jgi:hypothetical protein